MKRFIVFVIIALLAGVCAAPAMAEGNGLLNTNHVAIRVGVYDLDDAGDPLTYLRLTGQVNPAEKIDIFATYMVSDNDWITFTTLELGGNVLIPANIPMKLYAGAALVFVDWEVDPPGPGSATGDELEHFIQVGIEKDLGSQLAVNARARLDSTYDSSDMVGEGELIYNFDPKVAGLLGIGLNLNEADLYYQAGLAVRF